MNASPIPYYVYAHTLKVGAFIFKLEDLYLYTRFQHFVNGLGLIGRYVYLPKNPSMKWDLQKIVIILGVHSYSSLQCEFELTLPKMILL